MLAPIPFAEPLRLSVLDRAACEDWVLHVCMLSGHWRRRHAEAPFYTLGQAAYLDAGPVGGDYHDTEERLRNNGLLRSRFLPLLNRVAAALRPWTGLPVRLAEMEAALPGFHIYLPHPAFAGPVAKRHRDLQHHQAFPGCATGPGDVFSFTLPLSNPVGSGLSLWPPAGEMPVRLAYKEGEMVVHDGQADHRADLACNGDLERITLQGHGLRQGGHFLLYW